MVLSAYIHHVSQTGSVDAAVLALGNVGRARIRQLYSLKYSQGLYLLSRQAKMNVL